MPEKLVKRSGAISWEQAHCALVCVAAAAFRPWSFLEKGLPNIDRHHSNTRSTVPLRPFCKNRHHYLWSNRPFLDGSGGRCAHGWFTLKGGWLVARPDHTCFSFFVDHVRFTSSVTILFYMCLFLFLSYLYIHLSRCISVSMSLYLSASLSLYLSVFLFLCLPCEHLLHRLLIISYLYVR